MRIALIEGVLNVFHVYLTRPDPGAITPGLLGALVGGALLMLGLYGLTPQLSKRRKGRTVAYRLEHGDVVIALDPAQARLAQVLGKMPQVKKIQVRLTPDEDGRKVLVESAVVMNNRLDAPVRETQDLLNKHLIETATNVLGLEVATPIKLHVEGIEIDPQAASRALQKAPAAPADTDQTTAPSPAGAAPDEELRVLPLAEAGNGGAPASDSPEPEAAGISENDDDAADADVPESTAFDLLDDSEDDRDTKST